MTRAGWLVVLVVVWLAACWGLGQRTRGYVEAARGGAQPAALAPAGGRP